jgi:hypothetical protein
MGLAVPKGSGAFTAPRLRIVGIVAVLGAHGTLLPPAEFWSRRPL